MQSCQQYACCTNVGASIAPLERAVWECLLCFSNCLLHLTVLPEVDNLCCLVEQNDLVPARKCVYNHDCRHPCNMKLLVCQTLSRNMRPLVCQALSARPCYATSDLSGAKLWPEIWNQRSKACPVQKAVTSTGCCTCHSPFLDPGFGLQSILQLLPCVFSGPEEVLCDRTPLNLQANHQALSRYQGRSCGMSLQYTDGCLASSSANATST